MTSTKKFPAQEHDLNLLDPISFIMAKPMQARTKTFSKIWQTQNKTNKTYFCIFYHFIYFYVFFSRVILYWNPSDLISLRSRVLNLLNDLYLVYSIYIVFTKGDVVHIFSMDKYGMDANICLSVCCLLSFCFLQVAAVTDIEFRTCGGWPDNKQPSSEDWKLVTPSARYDLHIGPGALEPAWPVKDFHGLHAFR